MDTSSLFHKTLPATMGDPPHPALLLLHGLGSNEEDLLPLGPKLDPRLYVISARGPHTLGSGAYYWYNLEESIAGRPSRESIQGSLDAIRNLMQEVQNKYPIDSKRVLVGGFSMGGAMTAATLLSLPQMVAGALILSGYVPVQAGLPWNPADAAGIPVFQAHGIYDDVLPIQFGRLSRDFLQTQTTVKLTYREYPIAHYVAPDELEAAAEWVGRVLDGDIARP